MKKGAVPLTLGSENIGRLLIQYAIPAVIAMAAASLYNITDSIFIGHGVGHLALSGLSITFPIMNLAAAFGSLVGIGAASLLSIRLGQKDYAAANYILGNVMALNVVTGITFSAIFLIFLNPLLMFFGASSAILPYARDFMAIILAGNVITHSYMGLNALLRSAGHPQKAMYATIVTVLINLALNPLFIFGFGWGIRGSALATVIAQFLVLAWQIYFFSNGENFIRFQKGIYRLKGEIVKGILSIGIAPFLLNSASCVIVLLINRELSFYGGDYAVGAYGIVNRVAFLFVMIIFGINQGMQPIAGYNYGAALYGRVGEVLKKSIFAATLIMILGGLIVECFPHAVARVFTDDKNLADITARGLRYVFICYPLVGFQIVVSAFFQSIGMAAKTVFLSLTRQVIFLIPLIIILPKYIGISGIWLSMPFADIAAFALASCMHALQVRKFKKIRVNP
jgi:putative MATE family efflux protein